MWPSDCVQAGLVVERPSPFPVKAKLDLTEAVRQGAQIAFEKQSVVRLDHLLGEIVRLAPGAVSPMKHWQHNSAMIAGS